MKKKSTDYLGKAIIISLLLVIIDLIGGFAHLRFTNWFKWISTVILVVAIIIFCIQYGKEQTEGVTFGKVFGYGFKISLFVAIMMIVYTLISVLVIFPEFIDQVLIKARTDMEAKGGMSEDNIETALAMTRKFFLPAALVFAFLGTLFFGVIGSLLGAAFAKKSEPIPTVFQDNP
jgi:hypothetical protein